MGNNCKTGFEDIANPSVLKKYYSLSPFGTFWIAPGSDGGFNLSMCSLTLNTFDSAESAADAVFFHATGHVDWDQFTEFFSPTHLCEWGQLILFNQG